MWNCQEQHLKPITRGDTGFANKSYARTMVPHQTYAFDVLVTRARTCTISRSDCRLTSVGTARSEKKRRQERSDEKEVEVVRALPERVLGPRQELSGTRAVSQDGNVVGHRRIGGPTRGTARFVTCVVGAEEVFTQRHILTPRRGCRRRTTKCVRDRKGESLKGTKCVRGTLQSVCSSGTTTRCSSRWCI